MHRSRSAAGYGACCQVERRAADTGGGGQKCGRRARLSHCPTHRDGTTGQSRAEEDEGSLIGRAALNCGVEEASGKPSLNGKSEFIVLDFPDAITMKRRGLTALRVMTGDELLGTQFPSRDLILDPWLPEKGLAMIYGPRGIGKTHITLGCAYAIASRGKFLRWQAPRPRRVLVIDGEMPAVVLQERYARIVEAATEAPPDPGHFRLLAMDLQDGGFDLGNDADQRAIESELQDIDVIFVDNISTLARLGRETRRKVGYRCRSGRSNSDAPGAALCSFIIQEKAARNVAQADGRMC